MLKLDVAITPSNLKTKREDDAGMQNRRKATKECCSLGIYSHGMNADKTMFQYLDY
jgi:hypothetical protein